MLRLAGAQIPVASNIQLNKIELFKAIDWAKENEVDHLLTPEGSLSGYQDTNGKEREIIDSLKEVELHARGLNLHLGTILKEKEEQGYLNRNEIRHYNKGGDLRGITLKTLPIYMMESALPRDQDRDPIVICDLYEESIDQLLDDKVYEQCMAAGLICNDLYGVNEVGKIPLTTHYKDMKILDLIFHATNGAKNDESETQYEVFDLWHNAYLRMASWNTSIPILTVDSCTEWEWDGNEDEVDKYRTSSPSGLVTHLGWSIQAPRFGRKYFKYDYQPPEKKYFDTDTGEEVNITGEV